MADRWGQIDNGLSGASDKWDDGLAGEILRADYFETGQPAVAFSAVSFGGSGQRAAANRYAIGSARIAIGGRHAGVMAKIGALIAQIAVRGEVRALSIRTSPAITRQSSGGQSAAAGLKVAIGATSNAGGAFQIMRLAPASLPDVVSIAGLWIMEQAIRGVVAGTVTIAATTEATGLGGQFGEAVPLDGRAGHTVAIGGTRKRT
ncbi:MAG: hypothetical protein WC803_08810 [Sphingomonas sp.]|jgi:hypothetical protein